MAARSIPTTVTPREPWILIKAAESQVGYLFPRRLLKANQQNQIVHDVEDESDPYASEDSFEAQARHRNVRRSLSSALVVASRWEKMMVWSFLSGRGQEGDTSSLPSGASESVPLQPHSLAPKRRDEDQKHRGGDADIYTHGYQSSPWADQRGARYPTASMLGPSTVSRTDLFNP